MEALKNFFYDKNVAKILDVGTGSGDFIFILKETFPESGIVGVDPNSDALKEARVKFPDVEFQEMVSENLHFENNTFDAVSLSMALHHLPKVKKGLTEIKRVVKPEGWIIINELFSDNLNQAQEVHKMFHHFRSRIDRLNGISHRETFRKDEILQLVRQAGISVQFFFEHKKEVNLVAEKGDLEKKVNKMKEMLETIKGKSEYNELLPQIEEFKNRALQCGFQPATNLVIVGRKQH